MGPKLAFMPSSDPRLRPSTSPDDAWELISRVGAPELRTTRVRMRELLDTVTDPADRESRPGHLTGSALVVDADFRSTLLLFHTKLRIWVQPGGHADGDNNLAGVALREASEETGIEGLTVWPEPIDLDIHEVRPPKEDPHFHHDVRFLVVAPSGAEFVGNHESLDHRWIGLDSVGSMAVDAGVVRLADVARRLVAEIGMST